MWLFEVRDSDCGEDEAYKWKVPADASLSAMVEAIETLYPEAFSIVIEKQEEE